MVADGAKVGEQIKVPLLLLVRGETPTESEQDIKYTRFAGLLADHCVLFHV